MKLSEQEYRNHPAIAQSTLKLLSKSPAHARYAMDNPTAPSASMQIGTALHGLVLERKTDFVVMPESAKGNTNAAKAVKADFLLSNSGKIILSPDDAEKVTAMKTSVFLCKTAEKLLKIVTETEKNIFWTEKLAEVSNRTKTPGDVVLSEFQKLYKKGQLQFRMDEQDGVKVTLIRLKQEN